MTFGLYGSVYICEQWVLLSSELFAYHYRYPSLFGLFSHRLRHQPSPAATISMVISKVASGDINTSMQAFVQVWRVHVEHIPYPCTGVSFVLVCRCLDDVVGYRFGVEQDATKS